MSKETSWGTGTFTFSPTGTMKVSRTSNPFAQALKRCPDCGIGVTDFKILPARTRLRDLWDVVGRFLRIPQGKLRTSPDWKHAKNLGPHEVELIEFYGADLTPHTPERCQEARK